ncbi:MAG: hypothetical protein WC107_07130 [Patescibacteria group bacterium]
MRLFAAVAFALQGEGVDERVKGDVFQLDSGKPLFNGRELRVGDAGGEVKIRLWHRTIQILLAILSYPPLVFSTTALGARELFRPIRDAEPCLFHKGAESSQYATRERLQLRAVPTDQGIRRGGLICEV